MAWLFGRFSQTLTLQVRISALPVLGSLFSRFGKMNELIGTEKHDFIKITAVLNRFQGRFRVRALYFTGWK